MKTLFFAAALALFAMAPMSADARAGPGLQNPNGALYDNSNHDNLIGGTSAAVILTSTPAATCTTSTASKSGTVSTMLTFEPRGQSRNTRQGVAAPPVG